jgi:uncharacterized protein YdhG (YjbR/CyaY superfamily)
MAKAGSTKKGSAKTEFKSVDAYIAAQPLMAKLALTRVRNIIRQAVPAAEEVISYQIPAYRLPGGLVIFFAGWRAHYSLYPATDKVVSTFKKKLTRYEVSKGTIRFPYNEKMPVDLIAGIAKLRAKETVELEAAKADEKPAAKKAGAKKPATKKPAAKKAVGKKSVKKAAGKKVVKKAAKASRKPTA